MKAVPPYLLPRPERVRMSKWEYFSSGEWAELPEVLPDWDYNTSLSIRRRVSIDLPGALAEAALPPTSQLVWLVTWRATDSKLAGSAPRVEVTDGETLLSAMLPGTELGVAIDLTTRLVLARDLPPLNAAAAHAAGSVLHEDQRRIVLQGDLGQFPIAIVDFRCAGLDPEASFVVEIAPDPATPVLAGVLLLVNQRDEALVKALSGADTSGDAVSLVSQIEEGVYVQLLDHMVRNADSFSAEEWEQDTVGWIGLQLASRVDIAPTLAALAELREREHLLYRTVLMGEARRSGMGRSIST